MPDPRLKVLLLHPKTIVDSWPAPVDTLGEVIKIPNSVYPILASSIKGLPVDVTAFDGYVDRIGWNQYKSMLRSHDVIAITVMSPLKALDTHVTIKLIRSLNPRARIVLGGNHASAYPERWRSNGADWVIEKEGDQAFPLLIENLLSTRNFDKQSSATHTATATDSRPKLRLDDTPMPDWSVLNLKQAN